MSNQVNQERVNDTAKLIMHRLIARAIARNPSLVEKAKNALAQDRGGYSYVHDWNDILSRPTTEIRRLLTRRGEKMTRLRLSSPFAFVGIDFTEPELRSRIFRDARQIAGAAAERAGHA
jgi:hypothetical protein